MKISKTNNFVKMYTAMYPGSSLPKSVCPLFWNVLIGCVLTLISPTIWVYGLVSKVRGKDFYWFKSYSDDGIWTAMWTDKVYLMMWFISTTMFGAFIRKGTFYWVDLILGPLFFTAGLLTIIVIICVIQSIKEYIGHKSYMARHFGSDVEKKPSVMVEALKGWKNKVCPIIEYED